MDLTDAVLLLGAGLASGMANAIAGGGSLITFPALVATGLSSKAANVTNSVAVFAGYVASVAGSRTDLVDLTGGRWRRLLALAPTTIVGATLGCVLLLATPSRAFDLVVPFLILGAAAVLAFQRRLRALVGHPHDLPPTRRTILLHTMVGTGSVYGGYFGAALGIMLIAALGLVIASTLARISALKNVISALVGLVTVVVFALFGPVNWIDVAILSPASLVGGYAGSRLARRLPSTVLRGVIVAFAVVVGVVLLVRALR